GGGTDYQKKGNISCLSALALLTAMKNASLNIMKDYLDGRFRSELINQIDGSYWVNDYDYYKEDDYYYQSKVLDINVLILINSVFRAILLIARSIAAIFVKRVLGSLFFSACTYVDISIKKFAFSPTIKLTFVVPKQRIQPSFDHDSRSKTGLPKSVPNKFLENLEARANSDTLNHFTPQQEQRKKADVAPVTENKQ
ncbi:MAG: hypothetical protein EZS28_021592, partial [Streblomastix strix]